MPTTATPAWWTDAVVYQVYPRSFADADGDGIGDLAGLRAHLGHLDDLGVDVVWLSPIYPSPQDDNGYDIADYRDIDPTFGTLEEFDDLLTDVHERGMKLIMDLVVNHTSDEHPWFVESRSDPNSPKRDWYWWRGPRDGRRPGQPGAEPTNWGGYFGGSTWELDEASGEYYLHLFSRKQPDLNWENPDVRAAVHDMMNWWLDRGIDGFRMDVINLISKDPALPDGPPVPGQEFADSRPHTASGPRIHEFLQEMHREVFAGRDRDLLTVGEMIDVTVDQARRYTDPDRDELDMVFTFEHVSIDHGQDRYDPIPHDLPAFKAVMQRWQDGLADVGWNSLYLNNHDQPRSLSRLGDDTTWRARSATALATVLHLHRGTPYVYQGEEIGMANYPFRSPDDFADIESINRIRERLDAGDDPDDLVARFAAASRDNARTPVQWDDSPHAGFTTGTPWLPVNPDHVDWNVAAQADDNRSILAHYRRLIALRHDDPVVAHGDFTMLLGDHPTAYAFLRRLDDVELLVVANLDGHPLHLDLDPAWDGAEVVLDNDDVMDPTAPDGIGDPRSRTRDDLEAPGPGDLGPWQARILRRRVG